MSLSPEQGDPWATIRRLEQRIATLERADRLIASSVGAGGLTVTGGEIVIKDAAGDVQMTLSTAGLSLNGLLEVLAGLLQWEDDAGRVRLKVGQQGTDLWPAAESVRMVYQDTTGVQRLIVGEIIADADGSLQGHGILVQDASGNDLLTARNGLGLLKSGGGQVRFEAAGDDEIDLFDAAGNFRATIGPLSTGDYGFLLVRPSGANVAEISDGAIQLSKPDASSVILRITNTDGLRLAVEDSGGTVRSGKVTAGAADSGGVGFRLLRIPN